MEAGSPRAVSCEVGTQTEVEYSVEDQLSPEDQQKLSLGREVWDADELARGGLDPERDKAFRPVRPLQLLARAVLACRLETNSPDFLRVIALARNIWVDNAKSLRFPYRMKLLLWSALNSAYGPRSAHDFFRGKFDSDSSEGSVTQLHRSGLLLPSAQSLEKFAGKLDEFRSDLQTDGSVSQTVLEHALPPLREGEKDRVLVFCLDGTHVSAERLFVHGKFVGDAAGSVEPGKVQLRAELFEKIAQFYVKDPALTSYREPAPARLASKPRDATKAFASIDAALFGTVQKIQEARNTWRADLVQKLSAKAKSVGSSRGPAVDTVEEEDPELAEAERLALARCQKALRYTISLLAFYICAVERYLDADPEDLEARAALAPEAIDALMNFDRVPATEVWACLAVDAVTGQKYCLAVLPVGKKVFSDDIRKFFVGVLDAVYRRKPAEARRCIQLVSADKEAGPALMYWSGGGAQRVKELTARFNAVLKELQSQICAHTVGVRPLGVKSSTSLNVSNRPAFNAELRSLYLSELAELLRAPPGDTKPSADRLACKGLPDRAAFVTLLDHAEDEVRVDAATKAGAKAAAKGKAGKGGGGATGGGGWEGPRRVRPSLTASLYTGRVNQFPALHSALLLGSPTSTQTERHP